MLLLLAGALASTPAAVKIINGEVAQADRYPMAGGVLVYAGGAVSLVCSSTLIAPDVVMLAAHCVDGAVLGSTPEQVGWSNTSDLGEYVQNTQFPTDAEVGTDFVMHPDWSYANLQVGLALNYDIALVFLEGESAFPYAYLPTAEEAEQIVEGAEVAVAGWGMTDADDTTSYGVKNWGWSTIDALADYEFQVGAATDAVRKCHGDSGGPSFLDVESASSVKMRVIGVTSHTWDETDCQETGGVDTRADYYLEWIDEEMRSRCEADERAWCGVDGIPPPPIPMSDAELLGDLKLVGCATAGGRGLLPGVLLAAGLTAARRRPNRRR